jgi:hypothetical protein
MPACRPRANSQDPPGERDQRKKPRETLDLDPSRIFGDDSRELLRDMEAKGWPSRRLSFLITREPEVEQVTTDELREGQLFVPTIRVGKAATDPSDTGSGGRGTDWRLRASPNAPAGATGSRFVRNGNAMVGSGVSLSGRRA